MAALEYPMSDPGMLASLDDRYHRLGLIVGPSGSRKSERIVALGNLLGLKVTNLNLEISSRLLELSELQRKQRISKVLFDIASELKPPLLFDNIEVLFDRHLETDPLKILQSISRNKPVVAVWGGSLIDGRLTYAEFGHSEFRNYEEVDALIFDAQI